MAQHVLKKNWGIKFADTLNAAKVCLPVTPASPSWLSRESARRKTSVIPSTAQRYISNKSAVLSQRKAV